MTLKFLTFAVLAAATASASAPNQIPDLGLWLSAQELAPTLADGQKVLHWPDKSGKGYDAVYEPRVPQVLLHTGHHHPPTFKSGALAGRAAVAFDANDRDGLLLNRAAHALGQKISGFTALFLIRPTLVYGPAPAPDVDWRSNRYIFITHVSDYSTRVSLQLKVNTGEITLVTRAEPKLKLEMLSSFAGGHHLAVSGEAWHRIGLTVDYRAKEAKIFLDGQFLVYPLRKDTPAEFEDVPSPIAGLGTDTLGNWLTCQMAEVLCYQRALSQEEIRQVDGYLCATYHLP